MRSATVRANPVSYSERTHTFRTAVGNRPTARARSGSHSFVNFDIDCPPSGGLIPQHMTEHRPSCVQDRFCHLGFGKSDGVHVADNDQSVFTSDPAGLLMEVMVPSIGYFGVDRFDAPPISGTLRGGKSGFVLTIMMQGWNRRTARTCRQSFKPKIDADTAIPGREVIVDFTLECHVPSTARVLDKSTGLKPPGDVSGFPESEWPLEIDGRIVVDPQRAWNKWYPAKGAITTIARTESGAPLPCIPRSRELSANNIHGIGVDIKLCADSDAECSQVYCRWPMHRLPGFIATLSLVLRCNAEIPYLIARDRVLSQTLPTCCVLDAKFEGDKTHLGRWLVRSVSVKSAPRCVQHPVRSTFVRCSSDGIKLEPPAFPALRK